MTKQLIVLLTGLLLSSASGQAQGEKRTTSITPTTLPGEEKLSAQERAERDFLMPARRKQAEALRAAALEEAAAQSATDASARNEEPLEARAPEASPEAKAPTIVRRRTYHHRPSAATRYHTTARKKKTVYKSSSSKHKTSVKKKKTTRR